jgi:hypothetical protein
MFPEPVLAGLGRRRLRRGWDHTSILRAGVARYCW